MNNIYDNGAVVLGNVQDLKKYIFKNCEEIEEAKKILEDLDFLRNDAIVAINYNFGMGYSMDYWGEIDRIKEATK